ncbi:hypothetical protein [Roseibium aggregatum]|uniref:Phage minor structural protein GP20 n=1 Tax=Roseibium aggregatum TaxID=187304 RepID=A0A0M6Y6M8_9HYPH|nr:hypothetical protein [Roseibium aggregatum]CTQ45752.1 hypothetical protein LAL4801_04207 [Roseibium aggregatum]
MPDDIENKEKENETKIDLNDPAVVAAIEAAVSAKIEPINAKKNEILDEKKKLQAKLEAFDGVDPEEFKALKAAMAEKAEEDAKEKGDWQAILDQRETKYQTQLEKVTTELTGRAERAEKFAKDLIVKTELTSALVKAKVSEPFMGAVEMLLRDKITVSEDEAKGFKAFAEIDGDHVNVAEFVRLWSESEEGKHFVSAPANGGGGGGVKPGANSGRSNPWKADSKNLTEQAKILRTDRALARQLQREAGVAVTA